MRACIVGAPPGFLEALGEVVSAVALAAGPRDAAALDFAQLFVAERAELVALLPQFEAALAPRGMLWISWPKRAARVATDVDERVVREVGLAAGLVDVKVAAIDPVWSGLKFVRRARPSA
jgi:hypothetical protein